MKRTPLRRRTPLQRQGTLRRTPLGRSGPIRHKPHPDPLSPAERSFVLNRDRMCIAALLWHQGLAGFDQCANEWGDPIIAWTLANLTYEHVKPAAATGKRAPSKDGIGRMFGVACCGKHQQGWTSKHRGAINDWLDRLYPGRRDALR